MSTDPNTAAASEDGRPTPPAAPPPANEDGPGDVAAGTDAPEATEAARVEDDAPNAESEAPADEPDAPAADAEAAPVAEPDYKDLYLRAVAGTDNVRKRARRDTAAAEARALGRLARELLPALDNLERALAHAEAEERDEEHHLTKGIRLVQHDLVAALARVGIEPYSPKGEKFD